MNGCQRMKKIVIWGASGHAIVVLDILRLQGNFEIVGYLDDINTTSHGTMLQGLPILGGREQLEFLRNIGVHYFIVGVGNCDVRVALGEYLKSLGFELVSAIHPSAVIASDVIIKPGTVVAAGAVINPGCEIGESAIINTSSSIDHECIIGDGAHVSPGAHLAGKVVLGRATWIGVGASISDHITIGNGTIVGAGSVVVRDLPANVVAYGNPARVRKPR